MLGVFIYDLSQPKADLGWAIPGVVFLGFGAFITFLAWQLRKDRRKAAQAAKQAAELARAEDTSATPSMMETATRRQGRR
jgi:flagellar biosynthesis component FlhA